MGEKHKMLLIEHKAPFLYREDAYRDYCWGVDAWGMYQPASFIYLCFESFKELCLNHGLRLINSPHYIVSDGRSNIPWKYELDRHFKTYGFSGLIIRVENLKDAEDIQNVLSEGRNVIALLPNEWFALGGFSKNKKLIEAAIRAASKLGIEEAEEKIKISFASNCDAVEWEEILTNTNGRLFVTWDAFLSDGFFMEGYGKSEENLNKIKELIKEFSTFKNNLLSVSVRNRVEVWPCHEPLIIIIEVTNHGPPINDSEMILDFPAGWESLTPTERIIQNLKTLEKASYSFQIIPRIVDNFENILNIKFTNAENEILPIHFQNVNVVIVPSYGTTLRSQIKQDDKSFSSLVSIFKNKPEFFEVVKILPELVRIDIKACINKMRILAEKLMFLVISKKNINLQVNTFAFYIRVMQEKRILSSRSISYLHTIRIIGNIASHPSIEKLNDTDVRICSYALATVTEELIEKGII